MGTNSFKRTGLTSQRLSIAGCLLLGCSEHSLYWSYSTSLPHSGLPSTPWLPKDSYPVFDLRGMTFLGTGLLRGLSSFLPPQPAAECAALAPAHLFTW